MYRLILVEDEEEILDGLADFIPWNEIGFEVVGKFQNGNDAVSYLRKNVVDAIFSDIMMENGNGLDIAKYLYDEHRTEMVIFYTAFKVFDFAQKGIEYGVRHYITKDRGFHDLIAQMKAVKAELDTVWHDMGKTNGPDSKMDIILHYLARSYRTATLESVAEVVHMNPAYLSTYIKKSTGKNYSYFVTKIRMNKARELLGDESLKVQEIATLVGYSDIRRFIQAFKAYYRHSPVEYRRMLNKHSTKSIYVEKD